MGRVLVVVNDLLMGSKIREAVKAAGHEVVPCASADKAQDALAGGAVDLILADLSPRGADPIPALGALKASAQVLVIGYYSHVDDATRQRAQAAGVQALPRSAFFADLTGLIQKSTGG